jgi:hypothetical protein
LEQTDDIPVGVLHRGDQLATSDVVHVVLLFGTGVEQRLEAGVYVVIADSSILRDTSTPCGSSVL